MKWYPVKVYFPADNLLSAFTHEDEIRGNNPLDALKNAIWNWPNAEWIELI